MSDDEWSEDQEAGQVMLAAAFAAFSDIETNNINTGAILKALVDVKAAAKSAPEKPNTFKPDGLSVIASAIWARIVFHEGEEMAHECVGAEPIRAFARAAIIVDHLVNAQCSAADDGFPCGMASAERALAIYTKANEG